MANNVKIVLNDSGIQDLLKSQEISEKCREEAQRIVNGAKGNFNVSRIEGKRRAWIEISSADSSTYYRQLRSTPNIYDYAMRIGARMNNRKKG